MIFLFPRWDMLIPWRVSFWATGTHWTPQKLKATEKDRRLLMVRQVEKIWATIHRLCPLRGLPTPRARQGFVNFLKEKKEFRERIPYQERQKCVVVQDLPSCCILRKAQGRCQGKSITATQKRVADEDDQAGHSLGSSGLAHGPMAMRQLSSRATHCGTQPQYFLPQGRIPWPEFLNQISPRKPCVGENPLAWVFVKSPVDRLWFLTGMCWIRMPSWWKMGLHFRWSHGAATLYIRDVHAQGSTGKPEEATAGICSDL